MRHLGSRTGSGYIISEGRRHGPFEYHINVWQDRPGALNAAQGTFEAEFGVMHAIMTARGETSLEMQGGSIVKIVITHVSGDGLGEFNVSGPVPGF